MGVYVLEPGWGCRVRLGGGRGFGRVVGWDCFTTLPRSFSSLSLHFFAFFRFHSVHPPSERVPKLTMRESIGAQSTPKLSRSQLQIQETERTEWDESSSLPLSDLSEPETPGDGQEEVLTSPSMSISEAESIERAGEDVFGKTISLDEARRISLRIGVEGSQGQPNQDGEEDEAEVEDEDEGQTVRGRIAMFDLFPGVRDLLLPLNDGSIPESDVSERRSNATNHGIIQSLSSGRGDVDQTNTDRLALEQDDPIMTLNHDFTVPLDDSLRLIISPSMSTGFKTHSQPTSKLETRVSTPYRVLGKAFPDVWPSDSVDEEDGSIEIGRSGLGRLGGGVWDGGREGFGAAWSGLGGYERYEGHGLDDGDMLGEVYDVEGGEEVKGLLPEAVVEEAEKVDSEADEEAGEEGEEIGERGTRRKGRKRREGDERKEGEQGEEGEEGAEIPGLMRSLGEPLEFSPISTLSDVNIVGDADILDYAPSRERSHEEEESAFGFGWLQDFVRGEHLFLRPMSAAT